MKIEYVKGDLFDTSCNVIVHGCNAQGVMGSGVAKIIREKHPEAYEAYRKEYEVFLSLGLSIPIGSVIPAKSNGKIILNAITQEHYGRDEKRYVSYDAVASAFFRINKWCRHEKGCTEIAMPKIGAGLANGDWNVIAAIIESEMNFAIPRVYVI